MFTLYLSYKRYLIVLNDDVSISKFLGKKIALERKKKSPFSKAAG
jgi:hypothetical protein